MPQVLLSNGRSFPADPGTSVLDAARAHGVALDYSCRTGRCGMCKAPLLAGSTTLLRAEASLSSEELERGMILTCCRAAVDSIELDVEDLPRLAGIATRTLPARISAISFPATDLAHVTLRVPPGSRLEFLPGQYVDVIAKGARRSYSLANAPRADGSLDVFIRRYPGGELSGYWFGGAKPNDLVRLEGPFGTFFLRDEGPGELIFLATGTGIAPVKALLEEIAATPGRAAAHRLSVYWGNREPDSFAWSPPAGLDLRFVRLLTGGDTGWTGRRGYVQDAVLADGFTAGDAVVYACGSSVMIESARAMMVAAGLPHRRFYADAFVSSN